MLEDWHSRNLVLYPEEKGKDLATLGIVLATYNEAGNLPPLVDSLEGLGLPLEVQIFVVDDNSPDGTLKVANQLAARYGNISLITRPGKLGLGSALREGMKAALAGGCTHILTMDADISHNPQDVPRLLEVAETGNTDLVQGSRYVRGGGTLKWGWRRRLHSHVANLLCRGLLGSLHDSTTNFRICSQRCAQLVVAESRGRDFEFQLECVLIAMRHGLHIVEVPIVFTGRVQGTSKLGPVQNIRWALFFVGALISFRLRIGRFSRVPSLLP